MASLMPGKKGLESSFLCHPTKATLKWKTALCNLHGNYKVIVQAKLCGLGYAGLAGYCRSGHQQLGCRVTQYRRVASERREKFQASRELLPICKSNGIAAPKTPNLSIR